MIPEKTVIISCIDYNGHNCQVTGWNTQKLYKISHYFLTVSNPLHFSAKLSLQAGPALPLVIILKKDNLSWNRGLRLKCGDISSWSDMRWRRNRCQPYLFYHANLFSQYIGIFLNIRVSGTYHGSQMTFPIDCHYRSVFLKWWNRIWIYYCFK